MQISIQLLITVRYWRRHSWQLVMSLLALTIGVAVVFAVDIANNSAQRAMALSMDALTGSVTHHLQVPGGVDEQLYTRLRVQHGLQNIAPVVLGSVRLREQTELNRSAEAFEVMGIDIFAEAAVRQSPAVNSGASAAARSALDILTVGSALLVERTAFRLGLEVGDYFNVQAQSGQLHSLKLIRTIGGERQAAYESIIFVDIATAQQVLAMTGLLSRIDFVLADDSEMQAIHSLLSNVQLVDAARRNDVLLEMAAAFQTNLFAMSLLAMLVGAFLIYNSTMLSVLQRRRVFGLLRIMGITRGQLTAMILLEVFVLALVASLVGLVLGYVLGHSLLLLITRTITDLYFSVQVREVFIDTLVIARTLVAAVGVAIMAALLPALEAARSQPTTVLRRSSLERKSRGLLPLLWIAGVLAIMVSVMLLYFSDRSLLIGFVALFLLVLGCAFLMPEFLQRSGVVLLRVFARVRDPMAVYPLRSLIANSSRNAVAIASLAIAVSATVGVGVMIDSFRQSVAVWLEHTLVADIYLSDKDSQSPDLSPGLLEKIAAVESVDQIMPARITPIEANHWPVRLLAVQANSVETRFRFVAPTVDNVRQLLSDGNAVLISEPFSWKSGLVTGDNLMLTTVEGARHFNIAGVFRDYGSGSGTVVVDLDVYQRHWRDSTISSVGILLTDGADVLKQSNKLRLLLGDVVSQVQVISNAEIKSDTMAIFDRTFAITRVLRWLTIVVALVGILSALMAQLLERRGEFATLHALGVSRLQLMWLVFSQSGLIGLFAAVFAVPLGLAMAWVLIFVVNRRSFGWTMDFIVNSRVTFDALVLALIAALLAGLYPAWRVSRTSAASALRHD